jgi:hypothetical protein
MSDFIDKECYFCGEKHVEEKCEILQKKFNKL